MEKNWTQDRKPAFDRNGAIKMNEIAKTVFAPIYPVIAQNAITETGVRQGVCLDLGSGPAMLAIAMARVAPDMEIVAFDFSEDSRPFAIGNIDEANLGHRIRSIAGDVHAMPFDDGYASLIVSRGSMFFWDNLTDAFREIYRVLSPGGATYIGGGFGSPELRERIIAEMLKRDPTWNCYAKKKADQDHIQKFERMFQDLGCTEYRIIDNDTGFWIVLTKPK